MVDGFYVFFVPKASRLLTANHRDRSNLSGDTAMSVFYADYIGATSRTDGETVVTSPMRSHSAPADGTASLTFAEIFQNIMTNITLTCPKCKESSPLADFQVTLNELGFAPGTGYATAGAPSTASTTSLSNYDSPGYFAAGSSTSDLSRLNIEWPRGQDVSGWAETVHISNVRVANGKISWDETGDRDSWPIGGYGNCNANAWIIQKEADGSYKASTWEYVRKGQTTKLTENLEDTDVISRPPRTGERVGIMLAGITRNPSMRNIQARSNIVWITWP